MSTPLKILKQYWQHTQFRTQQAEIINAVLNKQNTIALLPTGGGKSLCYQVPTLLLEGVCVVVSPLIALINDQVKALKEKNIKAIALTSQLNQEEIITAFDNLQFGNYKFLYLSPEKLQSKFIQEKIKQLNVSLIAIDEAHCISAWGHDFRPAYLHLNTLSNLHPKATVIALTATATQKVLEDIQLHLAPDNFVLFKTSFERKNVTYQIIHTEAIHTKLCQILNNTKGSAIIYVNSRKQTKEICQLLLKNNFKSSYYHGGLTAEEKNTAYQLWINNSTPIMVATNAFGMGIDKDNVRSVIHINVPHSLENYLQETGRAGRDGENANAILLSNKHILHEATYRFKTNIANLNFVKKVYQHLNQYFNIVLGETPIQTFDFSLQEFCATYKLHILQTYNAIKILVRENIILLDDNYTQKSTLQFLVKSAQVFHYVNAHPLKNDLVKLLLRSYGGIFEHTTIINEHILAKKLNLSKSKILEQLQELHINGMVHFTQKNITSKLLFLVPREDNYTINPVSKNIEQQNSLKQEKLEAMCAYIQNHKTCRNQQLRVYFNEPINNNCGICDVCIKKTIPKHTTTSITAYILDSLKNTNLSSQTLCNTDHFSEIEILNVLKILLEENKIEVTSQNKFKLHT